MADDGNNAYVSYDQEKQLFGFHIPGVDKVVGLGKDQVEGIIKEVFPDELRKELGGALKDVESAVMKEVVGKVVIPVLSEVLKPLEKLVFSVGADILESTYGEVKKVVEGERKQVPQELIDRAIGYSNEIEQWKDNDWNRWLAYMRYPGYEKYLPLPIGLAREQEKIWSGWKPFVDAMEKGLRWKYQSNQELIDAFNKINFYVANSGNVSVGLYFRNMWDRTQNLIDTLNQYKHSGVPATRHDIMNFVYAVQPDALDITVSFKIDIGIQIGGSIGAWSVPAELFDVLLEDVLKEAGVPA